MLLKFYFLLNLHSTRHNALSYSHALPINITESEGIYFLTITIVDWLPVFIGVAPCEIVLESLLFCRKQKELRLYA